MSVSPRPAQQPLTCRIVPTATAGWEALKAIKQQAHAHTPEAFGYTSAQIDQWTQEQWEALAADPASFLAQDTVTGEYCGVALMDRDWHDDSIYCISGVWVAPQARRRGIADALLTAQEEWVRAAGIADVRLWVLEPNPGAEAFYRGRGYVPTGKQGSSELPHVSHLTAREYRLDLNS